MFGRTNAQRHRMQMDMGMAMPMSVMYAVKCAEVLPANGSCSSVCR